MKSIKYTAVALALIAAASFTSSAKAANTGDLILGFYDTNTGSTTVPSSYEVDLGSFSSLSVGETFDLGSSITSFFSSDSSASLVFNIAAAGTTAGGGGLAVKETAFTASSVPPLPSFGGNTTENTNISDEVNLFSGLGTPLTLGSTTSSNGTAISGVSVSAGPGSFETEVNNNGGSYGYQGSGLLTSYPNSDLIPFYTVANRTSGLEVATPDGGFQFGGTSADTTLTFDPVATPEPSAYALGLCAVALFWVLNRRRSVS
jgi:hypothetical protein